MQEQGLCKGQKYLVTGASGFIGSAVCRRLLQLGATVHGTGRREVELEEPLWSYSTADLTDSEAVDQLIGEQRPDFVIHLASCVTGRRELEWVRETFAANLQSAVNILVAAQQAGVAKTVLAGSLEEPDPAEAEPVPASPYSASKWCASGYARMMHALYGTRIATARIFMVYGPGQRDLRKLVPYVSLCAARGEAPQLMSGGRPVDWIYIDDVVDGLIRMSMAGPDDGSYVDLGSGSLVTTGDIACSICELAGTGSSPDIGALPDRPMEQVRVANAVKTEELIGWIAAKSLEDGLRETYEWYRLLPEASADAG
jgi:nucleoside-diphosphate-sugar epimerase